ncbi:MAG: aminoacetone oxidase family FAD-binding enzyme [Saprospiraceae bacterium]|nr:aminoacetone oxidase family FAD-binding enzyme [Saprospiraceae bacterium]
MNFDLIVIGGGAGGCFAAIRVAELLPGAKICILESARKPLSKVEVSGGGRCNVTHACFEPEDLVSYYPRGSKELLGPFYHFQPADMIEWLKGKGVKVKKEEDGRMFPESNSSATIINCFMSAINRSGVQLRTSTRATKWGYDDAKGTWAVDLFDGSKLACSYLLIASGSDQRTWDTLKSLGHTIIPPVPSLFTFNIKDTHLTALPGISKSNVIVSIPQFKLETSGPLLITHWGLSGPAILKLSAWGARALYACNYVFDVVVNWLSHNDFQETLLWVKDLTKANGKKQVCNNIVENIPSRLWKYLCTRADLPETLIGAEMSNKFTDAFASVLFKDTYRVTGKSTFKEEFVTAGGADLKQVDMRRFESKVIPGLFFAGEVLNIDALTGGFNFQAAWTGGAIAAEAIAEKLKA